MICEMSQGSRHNSRCSFMRMATLSRAENFGGASARALALGAPAAASAALAKSSPPKSAAAEKIASATPSHANSA